LPQTAQLPRGVLSFLQPAGGPVYPAYRAPHRSQVRYLNIPAGLGQQFAMAHCRIVG
jgi:hypothetical protein